MHGTEVSKSDNTLRLVYRYKIIAQIRKILGYHLGILTKPIHNLRIEPATLYLKCLRKLPMKHGNVWRDSILLHCDNHITVHGYRLFIHPACSLRKYPCPVHRETVCLYSKLSHKCIVFFIPMHMVTCCVRILVLMNMPFLSKHVPHTFTSSVLRVCALNLIGAARNAPHEIVPEHSFLLFLYYSYFFLFVFIV